MLGMREVGLGALPGPDVPDGPVRVLFQELHQLHHRAGWPSLRAMAKEVGCSHTTVSVAFSEPRVPRWGLLELIVETLDGDTDRFHRLWLAATKASGATSAGATTVDDATTAGGAVVAGRVAEAMSVLPQPAPPRQLPPDV